jgi:PTS system nitrogen regulatory IIA component
MDLEIKDVADLLSVSETTIQRWISEGKIPSYQMQDQYRFSRLEIEDWIMQHKVASQEATPPSRGGMQHFCLYRALHQGDLLLHNEGSTKEGVIRSAMRAIAPQLNADAEILSELLLDREQMMPTSLNQGIAVPHTRDFLHQGPADRIFVVYPQSPLEYGALDGELVHTLFFLFATTDKGHLQLLAKLAHFASDPSALAFLKQRPSKKELLDFIRAWES